VRGASALLALCLLLSPHAQAASLSDQLERYTTDHARAQAIAAARITPAGLEMAMVGSSGRGPISAQTRFEIGAITKLFTGLLLLEMAAAGATPLDAPIGPLVPRAYTLDPVVGDIRLEELARHLSGLPRITASRSMLLAMMLQFSNPYAGTTTDDLYRSLGALRAGDLERRGRFHDSNFGSALLGRLLEERGAQGYERLLQERVLAPIGMTATGFAAPPGTLAAGHRSNLRRTAHWQLDAYAPAGGLVSNLEDMAIFLHRALDGDPLIASSLRSNPRPVDRATPIGWIVDEHEGERLYWHNGRTGGFYAFVGVMPDSRRGLALLSNTSHDGNPLALALLRGHERLPPPPRDEMLWDGFMLVLTALVPLTAFAQRWHMALSARGLGSRPRGRIDLLHGVTGTAMMLMITWALGPWHWMHEAFWWAALALAAMLLLGAIRPARRLRWFAPGPMRYSVLPAAGVLLHAAFMVWFGSNNV
jgi:serine-type D-Ala-D-Ala carboxypeptidase/endopeptidase